MVDLKKIVRANILDLEPYRCARDDFKEGVLLDANENTHGLSVSMNENEALLELNRYPDPHQLELKSQIVDYRNKFSENKISTSNLCLGVGSDESIDLLIRCVCTPSVSKMLICPPTYGMYSVCAKINDVALVRVPLSKQFDLDVDGVYSALQSDDSIKLVYLTSPGNPTAKLLDPSAIISLLNKTRESWNGLIIVDEAYIDFSHPSSSLCTLVNSHPNLVVLQTLSKAFGLAGIRLGITYSSPELSKILNSMKYPYNISSLTSNVALRATTPENLVLMQSTVDKIKKNRDTLLKELLKLDGIGENIGGLDSNYLLVTIVNKQNQPDNDLAFALYNKLAKEHKVVVRFRGTELNCTGALRISIGTEDEHKILLEKFEKCLKEIRN